MARNLGWLPDPAKAPGEKPDLDFAPLRANFGAPPPAMSLRPFIVEVLDQGNLGSCVANAGFGAVRISHMRQLLSRATTRLSAAQIQTNPPPLGSRLMGYYLSRCYHHTQGVDSGTHLRTFFQALNKFGFCPEKLWPYSVGEFARMPPTRAFRAAMDQASPTVYRRILTDGYDKIDDVKRAVANGFAVTFGIDVDEEFVDGDFDPTAPLGPPRGAIVGGHAMMIVGYDGDVFDVCNSWGVGFGEEGFFKVDADYVLETRDDWIVESAPRFSEAA